MIQMEAPIAECDQLRAARRTVAKLARTDLPIVLSGELGTGRRTLAKQLTEVRERRTGVLAHLVYAGSGLGNPPFASDNPTPLVVEDLQCMAPPDQLLLAAWLKDGAVMLAATISDDPEISLTPQLAAVLSYPSMVIRLPPLRARGDDSVRWAEYFVSRLNPDMELDPLARQAIEQRNWSGNLLELRATVERAAAVADDRVISAGSVQPSSPEVSEIVPLAEAVADFKRRYILETLERVGGNRTQAARALDVDPRTVFRVLQQEDERD